MRTILIAFVSATVFASPAVAVKAVPGDVRWTVAAMNHLQSGAHLRHEHRIPFGSCAGAPEPAGDPGAPSSD